MTKDFFDQVLDAIKDRVDWETKQSGFYRLRNRQVGRSHKPYLNAPDMRYGLADTLVEKVKPLYIGQLFANDNLATFVSICQQDAGWSIAAAEWFDYQLKQQSNFQQEIFIGIDKHLEGGLAPIKAFWNPDTSKVMFDACNPLHVIVPPWTEDIQCADWLVHVLHLSEAQYRRNELYTQGDDFIKRIKGRGTNDGESSSLLRESKAWREGLTYGNDDQIILWECWHRESANKDAGWMIETISPVCGYSEPVRAVFGSPYDHGMLPFFVLTAEIMDKGYYSPRGITEITATHEMSLNKTWNGKLQHLDFHGVPTYKQTGASTITNTANYRSSPGGILPFGLDVTASPSAPIDFEKEMQFTRALAEDRIQVPDLSAGEHLSGSKAGGERVTATQINAIVGQSNQSGDMRARTFRLCLGKGLKLAWLLYVQFKKDELDYLQQGVLKQVPQEALHAKYIITPSGSPDSWNKGAMTQKRLAMYQLLLPNPYIKKDELTKWFLESDSADLIKRLFADPGQEQEKQAEQQAQEISIMLLGYPASVSEEDDDKTHLITLAQFVQRRLGQNEPITPELARLFLMHGAAHTEALKTKKDPALQQITQQLMPVIQILSAIAGQPDQPNNVVNMQPQGASASPSVLPSLPGGGSAAAPPPGSGGSVAASEPGEDEKIAIQAGNMLVNMAKAGIPVSHGELNTVLRKLNLPDLPLAPLPAVTSKQEQPKPGVKHQPAA